MTTERVAIIGAGLSGIACAVLLQEQGLEPHVFEARDRPGGRIHSIYSNGTYVADLGPTWVWPPFQPAIGRWLDTLSIEIVSQYNDGLAVLDYGPGAEAQRQPLPGQAGQVRLRGGPQALINACLSLLGSEVVRYATPVHAVHQVSNGIELRFGAKGGVEGFDRVIVAVPPRIAAGHIQWEPALPNRLTDELAALPTWMSSHAKAVILFEAPFWRANGLSGRIASHAGPIVEAHDHCGPAGAPAAIFGFIGIPAQARAGMTTREMTDAIRAQLVRCFGVEAPAPVAIHIEDWSTEGYTATAEDLATPMMHPEPGPPILREPHYEGRLRFAGAELASQSAGLIEGALLAAEHAVRA